MSSITKTLHRLAEEADAEDRNMECHPGIVAVLLDIAEAASELREATERYIAVSAKFEDVVDNPEWQRASRTQLDKELDLYIALDALAKIENP